VQEAVEACDVSEDQKTVIVLKNIVTAREILINEGQNVKIDTNGHSILILAEKGITNNGKLEIVNNQGTTHRIYARTRTPIITNNGELVIGNVEISHQSTAGTGSNIINTVYNTGKLIVNGGTITANTDCTSGISNVGELIVNSGSIAGTGSSEGIGIITGGEGKTTINGGNIEGGYGIRAIGTSKITMTGGTIKGNGSGVCVVYLQDSASLEMKGGSINGNSSNGTIQMEELSTALIEEGEILGNNRGIYATDTAKLIIKGGNVKATSRSWDAIGLSSASSLELEGGEIVSNGTGIKLYSNAILMMTGGEVASTEFTGIDIYSTTSRATITGGKVSSGTYSGYVYRAISNVGTLVLGEKIAEGISESPSVTSPEITGQWNGVYNAGTFKFYDGIITGSHGYTAIEGPVTEWEEGYEVIKTKNTENRTETAILANTPSVRVVETGMEYTSIQEAIEASETNEYNLQLLRSIVLSTDAITIAEGQDIKLDLAGYSIVAQNDLVFKNEGTFVIKDSSQNKTGKIENTLGIVVDNTGIFKLESGRLSHLLEAGGSVYKYVVKSSGIMEVSGGTIIANTKHTIGLQNSGTITINGGEIISENAESGSYNTGIYNTGEVIVNGGKVSGRATYFKNSPGGRGKGIDNVGGEVTINGGEIKAYGDNVSGAICVEGTENNISIVDGALIGEGYGKAIYIKEGASGDIEISGGELTATYGIHANDTPNTNIVMTGGTITTVYDAMNLVGASKARIEGGKIEATTVGYSAISMNNTSVVEVLGGEIVSKGVGINMYSNATLVMTGGEVSSTERTGIDINSTTASATVTGGGVSSGIDSYYKYIYPGINNKGTLILGEKIEEGISEIPSITNPEIIGTTYGVNNTGTFKFYDGTITGSNGYESIYGSVAEWEEGYEIIKTKNTGENTETAILANMPGAKILETGTEYDSVAEAIIASSTNNYTVQLLRSSILADAVIVAEEQNVVLDMAGYNLTGENEAIIVNNGVLKITNSTSGVSRIENQLGEALQNNGRLITEKVTIRHIIGTNRNTVINTGEMEIKSGTITNTVAGTSSNYTNVINNTGKIVLNGGTITSTVDYARGIYNVGEVIANSGSVKVGTNKNGYGIYSAGTSSVEVNGGTIIDNYYGIYAGGSSEIVLTGGIVEGTYSIYLTNTASLEMTGGIIEGGHGGVALCTYGSSTAVIVEGVIRSKQGEYSDGINALETSTVIIEDVELIVVYNGIEIGGTAKVVFKEGIIKSTSIYAAITIGNSAILEMTGGKVSSTERTGIYINSTTASATITGGKVNSGIDSYYNTIYPGIENKGTLVLGENNNRVSTTSPEIVGTSYGISNTGTFKFYDGIIKGPSGAINGTVTEVADDHKVQNLDDGKTAILEVDAEFAQVAELNGVYYNTLDVAIASASSGAEQTIKICTDVNLNEGITIPAGKNIKIDLNGYVIRGIFEGALITNNGTLTVVDIVDTSALLEGEVINAIIQNTAGIGIQNNGTLTVGVLDRTVAETKLTITGSTAGIVNSGSMTLYGGQVKGATAISGNAATPRSGYTITTTTSENVETTKLTSSTLQSQSDTVGADDSALPEQGNASTSTDPVAQYLISYDANGGENTPDAQYKTAGEGIELIGQPTRDGHTFVGWATEQGATEAEFAPGDTYEEDAILILYAIWE
jgi:uncharacterized repeat protein (TIGR02543 family)